MKPSRRLRKSHYFSSTTNRNDQTPLTSATKTTEIPISSPTEIPITVHLPNSSPNLDTSTTAAAVKIQSAYRSHRIKTLFRIISTINTQTDQLQSLIQRQETVDSIRNDKREKLRMNEALMALLLKLDAVPGVDPTVREARRKVSRRIVGLQEVLDSVTDERVVDGEEVMRRWEEMVEVMEREAWEESGRGDYGMEMERFCVEKFGFRCMERFFRGV